MSSKKIFLQKYLFTRVIVMPTNYQALVTGREMRGEVREGQRGMVVREEGYGKMCLIHILKNLTHDDMTHVTGHEAKASPHHQS